MRANTSASAAALLLLLSQSGVLAGPALRAGNEKAVPALLPRDGSGSTPTPDFVILSSAAPTVTSSSRAPLRHANKAAAAPSSPAAKLDVEDDDPNGVVYVTITTTQLTTLTQSPTPVGGGGGGASAGPIDTQVPTLISSAPPATQTVDAATFQINLGSAKILNKVFDGMVPSLSCRSNQVACISGEFATCDATTGQFVLQACSTSDKRCFAMPMYTIEGVSVGCTSITDAEQVLGITAGDIPAGPVTSTSATSLSTFITQTKSSSLSSSVSTPIATPPPPPPPTPTPAPVPSPTPTLISSSSSSSTSSSTPTSTISTPTSTPTPTVSTPKTTSHPITTDKPITSAPVPGPPPQSLMTTLLINPVQKRR